VHLVQPVVDGRGAAADHLAESAVAVPVFLPGGQHRHLAEGYAQRAALDQDLGLEAAVGRVQLERDPAQHARRVQAIARVIVAKREPEGAVLEAGGERVGRQPRQRHAGAQRLDAIHQPRGDHHALTVQERGVEQVGEGLGRVETVAPHLDHGVEAPNQRVLEGRAARSAIARITGVAVQAHRKTRLAGEGLDVGHAEAGAGLGHHHHFAQPGRGRSRDPFEDLAQPLAVCAAEQEEPDRRRLAVELRAASIESLGDLLVDPRPDTSLRRAHALRRTVKSA
jgi:hypothetical protein